MKDRPPTELLAKGHRLKVLPLKWDVRHAQPQENVGNYYAYAHSFDGRWTLSGDGTRNYTLWFTPSDNRNRHYPYGSFRAIQTAEHHAQICHEQMASLAVHAAFKFIQEVQHGSTDEDGEAPTDGQAGSA